MGLLGKAVLYYQFDRDTIFSGIHIAQEGYFSYERDGFGPVSKTENELIENLKLLLNNGGNVSEPYFSNIQNTFLFRDGKNCERVYESIINLDNYDPSINIDILYQYTKEAYDSENWDLFDSRAEKLLEFGDSQQKEFVLQGYLYKFKKEQEGILSKYRKIALRSSTNKALNEVRNKEKLTSMDKLIIDEWNNLSSM